MNNNYLDAIPANDIEALKIPPNSIEAEQAVIGGVMLDNSTWDQISDVLSPDDFYREDHRQIFQAIIDLAEKSHPFDVITLSQALESNEQLESSGGLAYLSTLAKDTPSAANVKAYAEIIRESSILRKLLATSSSIADMAYRPEGRDAKAVLDEAERSIFNIAEAGNRGKEGFRGMKVLMKNAVEFIDEMIEKGDGLTGVPTGFDDLDEMTSGLGGGDLVIVAGRPSMGKTTFSMNIAEYVAFKERKPVAIFSMEMPGESLALRLLSSHGRISQQNLRSGRLKDEDWARLGSAVDLLSSAPLFIDDTPALTPIELRSRARRLMREHKEIGLIVIDYLQLMQGSGKSNENRATEISEISRSLKGLAKELNTPVIALSQLNRSLEQRPNKRPIMSDLRESGAIEQDADLIMFIYRDEVYNEDSADKGMAEVIIGKQRNGPIGTVRLTFLGQFVRFENFAPDIYSSDDSI